MDVDIKKYNITSNLAQCQNCNWAFDGLLDGNATNACKKHVSDTGHVVIRETASQTNYHPKD